MIRNTFRIQAYDSMMYGYFCTRFIDIMFNDKSDTNFTNQFSPQNLKKKNDDAILDYFLKKGISISEAHVTLPKKSKK